MTPGWPCWAAETRFQDGIVHEHILFLPGGAGRVRVLGEKRGLALAVRSLPCASQGWADSRCRITVFCPRTWAKEPRAVFPGSLLGCVGFCSLCKSPLCKIRTSGKGLIVYSPGPSFHLSLLKAAHQILQDSCRGPLFLALEGTLCCAGRASRPEQFLPWEGGSSNARWRLGGALLMPLSLGWET